MVIKMIFVLVRRNVDFDLTFQQEWPGVASTNNLYISALHTFEAVSDIFNKLNQYFLEN